MKVSPRSRRAMVAAAACAVIVSGMTACSSDSDSGSDSAAPSADTASLGTPKAATGTPVTIGVISEGKGAAVDVRDEFKGARAAAEYANNYLGGIGGHPITIKECSAMQTPAGSTDCANQMVQAKVAAVTGAVLGEVDRVVDVLAPAGIPLIMHTASTQKSLATPGVFALFNGASYYGVTATQAKDKGFDKVAGVVVGVPAAEAGTRQIGGLVFGNAGIKFDVVPIAPGTPDMTPQIATANNADPDSFMLIGNDSFCVSAMKAIRTTSPDKPITAIDRCVTAGAANSVPNGYQDITVTTTVNLDKSRSDVQTFEAALAKYGEGAQFGATAAVGYAPMLGMVDALNAANVTDPTSATILAGMKSAPPVDYPLAGGIKIQCNGKQIPISPNICSVSGIEATADKEGNLSDYRVVEVDPDLYAMPKQ